MMSTAEMRLTPEGGMDVELVRRAQRGDREAFAALVPPAVERLMAVAYRILGDPDLAEGATQVAMISAWKNLPSLREPARFDAWLYRLVVNACRDEARRRPWEIRRRPPLHWLSRPTMGNVRWTTAIGSIAHSDGRPSITGQ